MTNSIVENKTFEEKMKDRIKESIGDLITDEELKKLLDAAMYDVFFKPSKIKVNSYDTKDGPSYLQAIVKELMDEQVRAVIRDYIQDNPKMVEDTIKEVVTTGVGGCVVQAMSNIFQGQLHMFQNNITQQLHNNGLY